MSKEQGFLGNIRYPRVSQYLSRSLTENDDGQKVNIPSLIVISVSGRFRISGDSKEYFCKEN